MDNKIKFEYIIIQAGGKGTRLENLTQNKPKALVSLFSKPNIFHLMGLSPDSKYIIIGDYKHHIFSKYLKTFCKYDYKFIEAKGKGTNSGISQALKFIPPQKPFMIVWCDIFFEKKFIPEDLNLDTNQLGLSNNLFKCRWGYKHGAFEEKSSSKYGVAGVFIFKNTDELPKIPVNGEFVKFLKASNIMFEAFYLQDGKEFGTLKAFKKISENSKNNRPFNKIVIGDNNVTKIPIDDQGAKLARLESNWYKYMSDFDFDFLPKVYSYNPIVMQKINGTTVYKTKLNANAKKGMLLNIVNNLLELHRTSSTNYPNIVKNDEEAILTKTKNRLDSIANLIPCITSDYIYINGARCINYYKKWDIVVKTATGYFGDKYVAIHGDPTFSNTLIETLTNKLYLIDPRGYYGNCELYGDEDYDWAKVYYSLVGNYDQLNNKRFKLNMKGNDIKLEIASSGWEFLEEEFFNLINKSPSKIRFYHAIIWLSLTSYAWDDYDTICSAFFNGIRLMQEFYEKTS